MTYEQLLYEPGPVARIILNRPEYRNALSRILQEEIDAAFAEAGADENVKVIVLSGNGPSFCAGLDQGSPPELADREKRGPVSDEPLAAYNRGREFMMARMARFRAIQKPIIAMVQGACINAGSSLIAGTDVIFAAEDARFALTEGQFTLMLDGPASARRLKTHLLEGGPIPAQLALEFGLVSRVYPNDQLESETLAYAGKVAERHPLQLAVIKHAVDQAVDNGGYLGMIEAASAAMLPARAVGGRPPNLGRSGEKREGAQPPAAH